MEFLKRIFIVIVTGIAVSFVVYILSQTLFYYPFVVVQSLIDDSHFSRRFSTRNTTGVTDDRIVIVDIDDESLNRLGRSIDRWPRWYFAEVTDNIADDGASLIFFDILFAEGGDEELNNELAESVRNAGSVVTGYYVNVDRASRFQRPPDSVLNERFITRPQAHVGERISLLSSDRISFSYRELIQASANIGYGNYQPDFDGVLRHIPLFMEYQQWIITSASLQLWLQLSGLHYTDAMIGTNGIVIDSTYIPTDRHTYMRINYRGVENVYQRISFSDVLRGIYEPGLFTDKIVMVGASAPSLGDMKRIPGKRMIPGVEVHAAALDTILSGRFLRTIGGNMLFVINILTGILSGIFFRFLHPLKGSLAILIVFPLLFYLVSMIFFDSANYLINTSIPTCTVLAMYFIVVFYLYCRKNIENDPSVTI